MKLLLVLTLALTLIFCSGIHASNNISANITSSKNKDPACSEEVATLTCSIRGRYLQWNLDGNEIVTYNNMDETCGNFMAGSHDSFQVSVVLASTVQDDEGFFECTSVMTLSSADAATVEVECLTWNTTMLGPIGNTTATHLLRVLGPNISAPQNFTASQIACNMVSEANLFNLSWIPINDIQSIDSYRVLVMGDGGFIDNTTVLHPDVTSTLISVPNAIKNLEFCLMTFDKCNRMSQSDAATIFYMNSSSAAEMETTEIETTEMEITEMEITEMTTDQITTTCGVSIPQPLLFGILSSVSVAVMVQAE